MQGNQSVHGLDTVCKRNYTNRYKIGEFSKITSVKYN